MGRGRLFDRWGGGFILATVLGLVLAYAIGAHLLWPENNQTVDTGSNGAASTSLPAVGGTAEPTELMATAKAYTLYVIQTGLFSKAEGAQKTVQSLQAKGFPASETRAAPYKVFAGAYASEATAKAVADSVRKQGFPDAFVTRLDVAPPAALPGGGSDQVQQTIAALTSYMQEAAQWWDGFAGGKPAAADRLAGDARAVETAGGKLQTAAASDAAVGDLVGLTSRAGQTGQEIAALAKAARPEAARLAMQDFLDLVSEYHDWAQGK